MPILTDVELNWCKVHPKYPDENKKLGYKPTWSVTALVSKEQFIEWTKKKLPGAKKIEDPNTLETTGYQITLRRGTTYGNDPDKPKEPVEVIDGAKNIIDMTEVGIANGSRGNIQYSTFEYTKNGGGTSVELVRVQVTDFIPYQYKQKSDSIDDLPEVETKVREPVLEESKEEDDGAPF